MAKSKNDVIYEVSLNAGTAQIYFDWGDEIDHGLYDPKFSPHVWNVLAPWVGLPEGKAPRMIYGERLLPDMIEKVPKVVYVGGPYAGSKASQTKDIASRADGIFGRNRFVSERFKDVIEKLEPGVHQFIPVSFAHEKTREPLWTHVNWYYLNILTWIAPDRLIHYELMGEPEEGFQIDNYATGEGVPKLKTDGYEIFTREKDRYVSKVFGFGGDNRAQMARTMRKEAIDQDLSGRHLFVTSPYFKYFIGESTDKKADMYWIQIRDTVFCSPEFKSACKKAGLKGLGFSEFPVG